jgi:hypothetical protein
MWSSCHYYFSENDDLKTPQRNNTQLLPLTASLHQKNQTQYLQNKKILFLTQRREKKRKKKKRHQKETAKA